MCLAWFVECTCSHEFVKVIVSTEQFRSLLHTCLQIVAGPL